ILLIDAGRREAEPRNFTNSRSRQRRSIRAVIPGARVRFSFIFKAGEEDQRARGTVLPVCPSPNFFGGKRRCARSEFLLRQAKGEPHKGETLCQDKTKKP